MAGLRAGSRRRCRHQSLRSEPNLQQVWPLIERRVGFAQAYAVLAVSEDMRLGRNPGFYQRLDRKSVV